MDIALYTLYALLVAGVGAALLIPLFSGEIKSSRAGVMVRYRSLVDERERLLQNLADLKHDLDLQKVSEDDYVTLRNELLKATVSLAQEIERLEREDEFFKYVRSLEARETSS